MVWNADRIKHLRLRMGWSQSDLARHLDCEPDQVRRLEGFPPNSSASTPQTQIQAQPKAQLQAQLRAQLQAQLQAQIAQLDLLEKMADSQAQSVLQGALAEMVMDENHTDQIPQDLVRNRFLT